MFFKNLNINCPYLDQFLFQIKLATVNSLLNHIQCQLQSYLQLEIISQLNVIFKDYL